MGAEERADNLTGWQLTSAQMQIEYLGLCQPKKRSIRDVKMKSPALGGKKKKSQDPSEMGIVKVSYSLGGKSRGFFSFLLSLNLLAFDQVYLRLCCLGFHVVILCC